jgi:hypothetical protein
LERALALGLERVLVLGLERVLERELEREQVSGQHKPASSLPISMSRELILPVLWISDSSQYLFSDLIPMRPLVVRFHPNCFG